MTSVQLDSDQRSAATSESRTSLIVAGAGTGKTTTLTARVSWLIEEKGLNAGNIVAVTFTNKAAKELKERVESRVGEKAEGLRLGTFHSISGKILRKHAELAGLQSGNYAIVDEDDAMDIMVSAAQHPSAYGVYVPKDGLSEKELKDDKKAWTAGLREFSKHALRQISLWKSWGLTEGVASDPKRDERSDEEERFAAAYSSYQYELHNRNLVDFGDLILKVVDLFDRYPEILNMEAASVHHIVVDEAQDANPVQVRWVQMISSVHGEITAVGDEDQNIYGFQGGYPGAMSDMVGKAAQRYVLKTNRRCTEEILRPAVLAVDYNRRKEPKVLTSGRHGDPVQATGHPTDANEAAWIAGQVAKLVETGSNPGEIALLFRNSHVLSPYEEALVRKKIPAVVSNGRSLLEREEVKDVIAMVRIAVNPYDDLSFQRLAARPSKGLGATAVEALIKLSGSRNIPFFEACYIASDQKSNVGLRKSARAAATELGNMLSHLHKDWEWASHTYDLISGGLIHSRYPEWLKEQADGASRLANIEAVHRLASAYDDAAEFLQEIALLTDAEEVSDQVRGKVRLSTIHSVKGLEFDHVFCPAFDFGVMPSQRSVDEGRKGSIGDIWNGPHGGGIEEERRLAHVAFTRAKETLNVSFSWRRRTAGRGKMRPTGPSSFMEECEFKWDEIEQASTAELGGDAISAKKGKRGGVVAKGKAASSQQTELF